MRRIEFLPDCGDALLFTDGAERVAIESLGLPDALIAAALRWVGDYDDSKLPWEATRDEPWLSEGRRLFVSLRNELARQGIEVVADEDYWRSG